MGDSGEIDDLLDGLVELKEQSELARAVKKYETAQAEIEKLKLLLEQERKNLEMEKQQRLIVEKNICKLYNTAKAEIARKDNIIREMRNSASN